MLSTPEFAAFAETVVPFLHVTSRVPDIAADDLLAQLGERGFPTLLLLDAAGKVVGRPHARSVAAFRRVTDAVRKRAAEREAARQQFEALFGPAEPTAGDATAQHRQTLADLAAAADAAEAAQPGTLAGEHAAARLLAAQHKLGGALPAGATGRRASIALMAWAEHHRDAVLFARLLADLRRRDPAASSGGWQAYEQRLQLLRPGPQGER